MSPETPPTRAPGAPTTPRPQAAGSSGPTAAPARDARQQHQLEQMKLRVRIARNLRDIPHKLIVMSGKGGVGKTTVAVNLASALARGGLRVGLLDLDLTNPNAPAMFDLSEAKKADVDEADSIPPVEVAPNLRLVSTEFFLAGRKDPVIWRGPIKMNVIKDLLGRVAWGPLDVLVVDLPPGTSDEPLTISQMIQDADGIVLVTTPQDVSLLDVGKSVHFAETVNLPILGVVENMAGFACPRCGEVTHVFGEGGGRRLAEAHGLELLGSIPLEARTAPTGEAVPYVWSDEETPAGKAFAEVVAKVRGRLEAADEGDADASESNA